MKLAWATDIHLDFIHAKQLEVFAGEIAATGADGLLISGDISKATGLDRDLRELSKRLSKPIWFVLGNHDFYLGSVEGVRRSMRSLPASIRWLHGARAIDLGGGACLVGCDGWGDARLGNVETTPVMLNDFRLIKELTDIPQQERIERLRALGDESAMQLRASLESADAFAKVFVLTHVPPFREACWHESAISSDDWLPYFTCAATGEVLREFAAAHAEKQLTVLCGHTHSAGTAELLPNLRAWTGGAAYGKPRIASVLEIP
jgi:Icc protein